MIQLQWTELQSSVFRLRAMADGLMLCYSLIVFTSSPSTIVSGIWFRVRGSIGHFVMGREVIVISSCELDLSGLVLMQIVCQVNMTWYLLGTVTFCIS